MKLYLENVRSFAGWREISIAPATVLLGENSAGKSTLLGMLAAVHHAEFPFGGKFFNEFPFEFGGYKTLANSNKKQAAYFSIGFELDTFDGSASEKRNSQGKPSSAGLIVAFRENDGLPVPCHYFAWIDNLAFAAYEPAFESINRKGQVASLNALNVENISVKNVLHGLTHQHIFHALFEQRSKKTGALKTDARKLDKLREWFLYGGHRWTLLRSAHGRGGASAMAFAPMRSRPKRTYDQLSDEFTPEGDHVPLLLARATDPENKRSKELHEALRDFGSYSDMFADVTVKKLGRGSGDPFQVQVKIGAKSSNLVDVGYGVSQILPLIVDAQRVGADTMLLLQQPEVHLHPKAQAALGSMIKDWVSKSHKTVVVETHSDYLIDRLRLEVKRGNLNSSDLKIYFLEKKGTETTVNLLNVDLQGNVIGAPSGYRDFFLREQLELLGD